MTCINNVDALHKDITQKCSVAIERGYNRVNLLTSKMSRLVSFGSLVDLLQEMESPLSHTTPALKECHDQLAHANEVRKKIWRKSFVKSKPKIFKNIGFLPTSKSISKSRQDYNVMTNNINHFREFADQAWEKHSHDHFRTPTAHDMEILIKTCLMPLALKTQNDSFKFVHELKQEMHADLKYVESLEKEFDELESNKAKFSNMYDILLQECVSNDVMCSMCFITPD
ncbi:hypothetical protein Tco_0268573 [Tanacetum coccineum]